MLINIFDFRLLKKHPIEVNGMQESTILNPLKRRVTFIKYRPDGHTYARIYYLTLCEDAIHYQGSRKKSKREACMKIND